MERINIIWNLTRLCPFSCSFCCVSAIHVRGFKQVLPLNNNTPAYQGELSFSQQIDVLNQMNPDDFRIDFSGGDVFINPKNIDLALYASKRFDSKNVGLSIPGTFIDECLLERLKGRVLDIEITLDNIPEKINVFRPDNYVQIVVDAFRKMIPFGFSMGAQTVLREGNMDMFSLEKLHKLLSSLGIKKWSLLKFFPVGRFYGKTDFTPSDIEYRATTKFIEDICKDSFVTPYFQYLLPHHRKSVFKCRAVEKSVGINPSGYVSACFWALDNTGTPLDGFKLGRVPEENIYDILNSENAMMWKANNAKGCENYCGLLEKMKGGFR